jgi:SAM-dependent methyltransferase
MVVDEHVKCGQEGVSVFAHTLILDTLLPCPNPGATSHDLHGINHLGLRLRRRRVVGAGFAAGEDRWRARLGTLRQVVRQELVAEQLAAHLPDLPPRRVLDVGCGQGTQALLLARRGHQVTGLDSSVQLLADLEAARAAEPPAVRERVRMAKWAMLDRCRGRLS